MSENLPSYFALQFATNIQMKLQTMGSMLRPHVSEATYMGVKSAQVVDQVSQVRMNKVDNRFGPMKRVDAAVDSRWVSPADYDLPQLIDRFDKLKQLTDPESTWVQNSVLAAGRELDVIILRAATGTAKTGVDGTTDTVFNSSNTVTVSIGASNSRINTDKLLALKELMRIKKIDFDRDQIIIPLTAKDENNLLKQVQIVSNDFTDPRDKPVLVAGKLRSFLGFNFVYCEESETISAVSSSRVDVPVWAKSGMHLGMWNDITSDISRRNDLTGLPWQAYTYMSAGATRLEENKVYVIQSFRP